MVELITLASKEHLFLETRRTVAPSPNPEIHHTGAKKVFTLK